MDIAFLGLGGMGSGMARSLMKHGHKVTAWNRSSEPAEAIHEQGAQVAATPAEAAGMPRSRSPCSPTTGRSNP